MKGYKAAFLWGLLMTLGHQTASGQALKQTGAPNAQIERGRYVVEIGGCNDCHTAGYAEAGGKAAEADRLRGDTLAIEGPGAPPIRRTSGFLSARWRKISGSITPRL